MRGYTTVSQRETTITVPKTAKNRRKIYDAKSGIIRALEEICRFFIVRPKVDKNWLFGCKPTSAGGLLLFSSLTEEGVYAVVPFLGRFNVDQQKLGTGGASGAGAWSWGRLGDAKQRVLPQDQDGRTSMDGTSQWAQRPPDTLMMSAAYNISTSALDATPAPGALAVLSRCLLEVG